LRQCLRGTSDFFLELVAMHNCVNVLADTGCCAAIQSTRFIKPGHPDFVIAAVFNERVTDGLQQSIGIPFRDEEPVDIPNGPQGQIQMFYF
jgi:hypothetical protein